MNRTRRQSVARDTVVLVEQGWYAGPAGRVELAPLVAACLAGTVHHPAGSLNRARREALAAEPVPSAVEVRAETTLAGAGRLLAEGLSRVAALNFASARNPGGGFLTGAQAQEESLARSSGLYASLLTVPAFYAVPRGGSCLYTNAAVVSPDCPVFRDDAGELLAVPYPVTFITCAAPNAGAVAKNSPHERDRIPDVLARRSEVVLAAAWAAGCDGLVLGAWGCGVFRNDPATVAAAFAGHLRGAWAGRFRRVCFSIHDPAGAAIAAFRAAMGNDFGG